MIQNEILAFNSRQWLIDYNATVTVAAGDQ